MPERSSQLLSAIGEELRVVVSTRDGDIRHSVIEQVFCAKAPCPRR